MKIPNPRHFVKHSNLHSWADKRIDNSFPPVRIFHLLVRLILITAHEFKRNALSLRAGALTYSVLLALVPILAISTAVVKGLGGGNQLRKAAYTYIDSLEDTTVSPIPDSTGPNFQPPSKSTNDNENLTDHLRAGVDKLFNYVDKTNFATLGTVGVVGILLSAILVLSYIEEAMNAIWKVTAGRSLLRKISDYLTLLIIMPISINVAFAASAFLKNPVLASKVDRVIPFIWLQALLLKAAPVLIIGLTFYVVYIFFPNTKVKTVPALVGSFMAAILWFGVQNIYITMQVGVAKYNAIYGSFATLPLFLIWIYLGWLFILSGAQVAFACQHLKTYRLIPYQSVPTLKLAAAFDVMDLVYRAFSAKEPITEDDLVAGLPQYPPAIFMEILPLLTSGEILHRSQADERLLPAISPRYYDGREVVEIIFGTDAPDTDGGIRSFKALDAAVLASRDIKEKEPIDGNLLLNQETVTPEALNFEDTPRSPE